MKSAQWVSILLVGFTAILGPINCRSADPPPPLEAAPKKPDRSKAIRAKMKRYQALAKDLTPVAKTEMGNIFEIEGEFYGQKTTNDKIVREFFGKHWKNDEGAIVFWGNASAQLGNMTITPDNPGEIHLFRDGKFSVVSSSKTDDGRSRISIPVKDN